MNDQTQILNFYFIIAYYKFFICLHRHKTGHAGVVQTVMERVQKPTCPSGGIQLRMWFGKSRCREQVILHQLSGKIGFSWLPLFLKLRRKFCFVMIVKTAIWYGKKRYSKHHSKRNTITTVMLPEHLQLMASGFMYLFWMVRM